MRKKIGLALGSGGVKGIAHIGVIKTLVENQIPIDFIAGTSIGAWMGAHYALDLDINNLEELIKRRKEILKALLEPNLKGGLIKGVKLQTLLTEWFDNADFRDLKIPFKAVAVDLVSGKPVILSTGKICQAVRASTSIPSLFKPINQGDKVLIDGGSCNPVPVDVVRNMGADIVIAVNLDNYRENNWFKPSDINIAKITARNLDIIRHYLAEYSMASADIIIEPKTNGSDFEIWKNFFTGKTKSEDFVQAGIEKTLPIIPKIKKLLALKTSSSIFSFFKVGE